MKYLNKRIEIFNCLNIEGESIIDYGGGDGNFLEHINIKNKYIIDIIKRNSNIDFFYPFEFKQKVDIVFMNMTLHHLENLSESLIYIKQLLKTNSKLVIREFDASCSNARNEHEKLDIFYQEENQLNNFKHYRKKEEWDNLLGNYFRLEKTFLEPNNLLKAYWQIYSLKGDESL